MKKNFSNTIETNKGFDLVSDIAPSTYSSNGLKVIGFKKAKLLHDSLSKSESFIHFLIQFNPTSITNFFSDRGIIIVSDF